MFAALSDYQECDHRKSSSEYKDLRHWSFYNIVLGCDYGSGYWDLGLFHTKSELRDFFGWGAGVIRVTEKDFVYQTQVKMKFPL